MYDNALLAVAYLEGYQVTGREEFSRVAREILTYVAREMTAKAGGFYSATDADSLGPDGERDEGWFFTWTPQEIETRRRNSQRLLIESVRLPFCLKVIFQFWTY